MVDIHFHLLPGLDDGPDTLEMAVEMARMAMADGTTHIVATPHANPRFSFDPELIAKRAEEVRSQVGDQLTILTGCDFHLSFENLQDIQTHRDRYTINHNGYLLVEFASYSIPPQIDQAFHELQLAGITPIVTHPERNRILRGHTDWLDKWVSRGCAVQVTAGSLLGRFGPNAQEAATRWLETDRIHVLASDAHNTTSRPPELAAAYERVAEMRGEETARALCIENPLAAVEGKPLPWMPEPRGTVEISAGRKRKRFWFF
ncbi:MAG TPA: CpsB/CapC family capsule biosynthesis tyrosine phosphatase [Patescibacteria group bacterium]|nr:CpsB/CapC family capsule biosynthesis tyrosine phosphatase [Patescibacteria group bacterium]